MNCRDFLSLHTEYVDALIDPAQAARLRSHAATCPSCERYDRVVRRGAQLARELPRIEVSDDFLPRVRHRLFHLRDDMARRRAGSTALYAAVASLVMIAGAAAIALAIEADVVPVVDSAPVWAAAPTSFTPVRVAALTVASTTAPTRARLEPLPPAVAMIASQAGAHDPHVASPAGWPVYSRAGMAVAFPGSHTSLVVTPADFRQATARRQPAGALLIRH